MTTAFPETAASWARLKTVWREMITDYRRLKAVKHLGKAIDGPKTLHQLVMRLLGNVTDAECRKVCDAVEREKS
jgi:hypothetical protein